MSDALRVLDELEVRRSREYEAVRRWLLQTTAGHGGPISDSPSLGPHDGRMAPLLLDLGEVAGALRLSLSTVKRLLAAGTLPAVEVAGKRRVRRCDLEAYVEGLGDGPVPA